MAGLADRLDVGISCVAGVVVTLSGFGLISKRPGGATNPRTARFVKLTRWLGPLLIVISAIRLVAGR